LPDCYDDWIQPDRERLRELLLEALERLIWLLEQEQEYSSAIRYAERLLHQDPLREETYRQLMRLHALSGDRMGVARVYQTCVNVLKRELDVEVSPKTQEAYQQFVQMEIPPTPFAGVPLNPRITNLPIPLTSFIGREQQIDELRQLLLQRSDKGVTTRLLTLTGPGGCGKTRLALEVAAGFVDSYNDGVWLVELAALSDPILIPQTVATVFNLHEYQKDSIINALVDYLTAREILLILDNCEHLLDSCAQLIQSLLQGCPKVQILATSRERMNIPGETIWLVPPLSLPDSQDLGASAGWKQSEAIRLFIERAISSLPTFEVNQLNAGKVMEICRRLDGIPLAIELAAARINVITIDEIAERLQDRFALLTGGSRTALPKHQTLRATMDWSYELLSENERAMLRGLSVFAGGWTLEAAEAIQACDGQIFQVLGIKSGAGQLTRNPVYFPLLRKSLFLQMYFLQPKDLQGGVPGGLLCTGSPDGMDNFTGAYFIDRPI
jgi:predicted ATPase